MPPAVQRRVVEIKIDASGAGPLNDIAAKMGGLTRSVKSLSGDMGFLTGTFQTFLGFLGARELVALSDKMQSFGNTLKITTGSADAAADALVRINTLATQTNQGIDNVGQVFNRLSLSMRGTGATTAEVLDLTKTLINSFRVAGATTTETANTIIQLSQAFSSGELRGQELRSVLEQNAVIAGILRQEYGKDLFKKAEQGAIKLKDVLRLLAENQNIINQQAQELTPTFEQGLTRATNELSLAVNKLNTEFNLSGNFYKFIEFFLENKDELLVALSFLAATAIPLLTKAMLALNAAVIANPIGATIAVMAGLAFAIIKVGGGVDKLVNEFLLLGKVFQAVLLDGLKLAAFLPSLLGGKFAQGFKDFSKGRQQIADEIQKSRDDFNADKADEAFNKLLDERANTTSGLASLAGKLPDNNKVKVAKIKDLLADINKEFAKGVTNVEQYNAKLINFELVKLTREFKEGKKDLVAYQEGLAKLNIQGLNRELASGTISVFDFNDAVKKEQISVLNAKLNLGRVSLQEYNAELTRLQDKVSSSTFQTGITNYIDSVGSLASNVAKSIQDAFGSLETAFSTFVRTGKLDFKDFANSVLDDLARIIARQAIVKPLANAALSLFGPSPESAGFDFTNATPDVMSAKGNVFDGGLKKFASGGVVNSPTMFGYGNNKKGLMGEAGPEAILPLGRGKNGDLGVQATITPVTINIINNAGVDVQQQESTGANGEKQIELLINTKVKQGIASGAYDSAMSQSYGVRRKGL